MLTTRRRAIRYLAAALAARPLWPADSDRLRITRLDHAHFQVPDGPAAAKFYARVFGGPAWKHREAARWYVMLGRSYLVLEESADKTAKTSHLSLALAGFEPDALHRYLDAKGLAYQDFLVTSPEGPAAEL